MPAAASTVYSPLTFARRPAAVHCSRPRLHHITITPCASGRPVEAPVEIRVVCLILRDGEIDIGPVRYAVEIHTDREHGALIASVLAHQPAQVAEPVSSQVQPEPAFAE